MNEKINKMELLIKLNDNIVIQRDWNISNYDTKAKNSIEFLEFMDYLKEYIVTYLARKSSDYMVEYKKEIVNNEKFLYEYDTNEDETFYIYIKKDDEVIACREIPAKIFPAYVRYKLDVRPFISSIKEELTYFFTTNKKKSLTYEYLGYPTI